MRRGVELLYVSGCQHFLAFVVRIFRRRVWTSLRSDIRMVTLWTDLKSQSKSTGIICCTANRWSWWKFYDVSNIYYSFLLPISLSYRFISIQRSNTHWFYDSRIYRTWSCCVFRRLTRERKTNGRRVRWPLQAQLHTGYWISGDYFRQTSSWESAGDAGESDIEGETRRDMRDNNEGSKETETRLRTYNTNRTGRMLRADEALFTSTTRTYLMCTARVLVYPREKSFSREKNRER